jgi:hypothetical protein
MAQLLVFTKEIFKNTKENMPPDRFCYHLRQDGQIDLPSSPDCHIYSAVSENTHQPTFNPIMAIRLTGHMAIMASNVDNMGVFGNSKCGNLVKTVSQFDHPASYDSKNGTMANFPLYFLEIPL